MRSFGFIFTILFLTSCGGGGGGSSSSGASGSSNNSHTPSTVHAEEISLEGNVPLAADTFDIKLNLEGFNKSHKEKVYEARELIKEVIASQEFKDQVLGYTYKGKRQFADNGGLTNEQVYKKILEGSEKFTPGKDNQMDLYLKTYSDKGSTTVGYTYKNVKHVWMNTKYLSMYPAAKITTNMVHEWLHKVGFTHDVEKTAKRPHSVPYAVGYIVRDLAARI